MLERKSLQFHFEEQLLHSQIEIQEQTMKNISQEIHDNIGQTLSLAKLNLSTIDVQNLESAVDKIANSKEMVSKAILDLRDLSRSLNTDAFLSAGLVKGIATELAMVEKSGIFHTQLDVNGNQQRMDAKKELIVFRVVQEAINNIIKHSAASMIGVAVAFNDHRLEMKIKDNGKGFTHSEVTEGSGLRNMKNRIQLIGGELAIASDSNGTVIHVTVPNQLP